MSIFNLLLDRLDREIAQREAAKLPISAGELRFARQLIEEASHVDVNLEDQPRAWEVRGIHAIKIACRVNLARSERHRDLLRDEYERLGLRVVITELYAPTIDGKPSTL